MDEEQDTKVTLKEEPDDDLNEHNANKLQDGDQDEEGITDESNDKTGALKDEDNDTKDGLRGVQGEEGGGLDDERVITLHTGEGNELHSQEMLGLLLQQNNGQVLTLPADMVSGVHPTVASMEGIQTVSIATDVQLADQTLAPTQVGEGGGDTPQVQTDAGVSLIGDPSLGQVVTLANGQQIQAVSVALTDDGKMLEGQTVQLADGTTAIVQNIMTDQKPQGVDNAAHVGTGVPKLVQGQAIQLEDGSIAYIQNTNKEGLQAVQLEDGTTAYIATPAAESIFTDGSQIDSSTLTLEPLNQTNISVGTSGNQTRLSTERAMSMSEKAFRCNYEGCGRLYTTQHHLKVHERSHTGDRPFKCKHTGCGKAFATSYGLKSHTRVHTGEKPYRCPEDACDKAFKTSGDLQKHVRTHTGERPFKCPFQGCDRSFTTSNIRKVHIRTHTGERPYICEEDGCNKAFASATNYKNHIRIHTGEKPYVCTVEGCGKRFTEYSSLYKHHVVHTHSKPYMCSHCGKNYRQTSTLAMHKRTAHGDESAVLDGEAPLLMQGADLATLTTALPSNGAGLKRIQVQLPPGFQQAESAMEEDEGALVINTSEAQQVTMMSDSQVIGGLTPEAAQATLRQLTAGHGITLADTDGQQHIYLVTDPAQLEALQQLTQQQLLGQGDMASEEEAPPEADTAAVTSSE